MSNSAPAIVGMGLVCCLGSSVAEVFDRMCRGECGIRPITRFPAADFPQPNGGQLPEDVEERLREQYPDEDLVAGMIKEAGKQALAQARVDVPTTPDPRFGLVLATNFGPMETFEWCWRERLDVGSMDADTFASINRLAAAVAEFFGCGGPVVQLSMSCASGASAVALAADWLRTARADRVLAIGYDALTECCWTGLTNLRTITTDVVRPFDGRRAGTIFSEGAGAMLLERCPADANSQAPERVVAWLAGSASNNNAFHMTAPAKEGDGSRRVMAAALADAGIGADEIDHVCAHATGTSANDVTEAAALRNLFGDRLDQVTVAAHKSQLGHILGAAGIAEAIVTVEVLNRGVIPPTINHEQPDPKCRLDCVPGKARQREVACAITNSAGIGGNNGSLVLCRADRHAPPPYPHTGKSATGCRQDIDISGIGWVLPTGVGSGAEILHHPEWLAEPTPENKHLAQFNARPYLQSVKGYLDPAGAYCLSAASLALGEHHQADGMREDAGISTVTQYGAPTSGFRFYEQLVTKGTRMASPLMFPHGYSNTAGNLAAIEFGFGGPHIVLYGAGGIHDAFDFALTRLRDGSAAEMIVAAYEAVFEQAVPDGLEVRQGGICVWLSTRETAPALLTVPAEQLTTPVPAAERTLGSVHEMLWLLQHLGTNTR